VADAVGVEDPHRGLKRSQLEAEDEAVADKEMVAEGEGLLAPGEDGAAANAKDDVHWPDKGQPALLHQCHLAHREAWGGEDPPYRLW
jgi:hypothetical protein